MRIYDHQVDIVIPVYNALEDLKKCVLSILKNTDLKFHRLILINDKSSDENVKEYLSEFNHEGIYILENEINLGFSGTINRGLVLSDKSDIILLNSDTIVTSNWIEDLIECAYMDEGIGTVTPLSNNASICSVPISNQNNVIPKNIGIDKYAQELKRVSLRQFPDIPVGNGFCMYIKRSVIEDVGMFDSKTFGRGYGEENDFCNRATELGYRHVLCDTVFVYHKGTASFSDEHKIKLIREHEKVLEERYPNLIRKLEWYWAHQQNSMISKNVELYQELGIGNDKKNIFYLIQADFQQGASNNVGGTQLHVKDLVEGLKLEHNIFVAARDQEYLRVTAYIGYKIISFKFYIGVVPEFYKFRDKEFANIYKTLLIAFKIDLVHIHHTMGMSLELYYMANELNIPIFVSLHDYYYICPKLQLLDRERNVCIGEDNHEKCNMCMKEYLGIYEGVHYIDKWRKEHERVLKLCNKVIIPSTSAADIILQYFPRIEESIMIVEHGIDTSLFYKNERTAPNNHKELHVAFVGGICETKGSELIYSLILNSKKRFKWHIFGGIDSKELHELKQDNLIKTGWYKRDELKDLLKQYKIDVVCILSKVAETYCYTLSEVVACGVPVIVTDVGALGERMRKMKCGWILPLNIQSPDLLKLLFDIQNDFNDYNKKYYATVKYQMRSTEEMILKYNEIYEGIRKLPMKNERFSSELILNGYINNSINNNLEPAKLMEKVNCLTNELELVYDSELYKILKKLAGLLDFFKKILKNK